MKFYKITYTATVTRVVRADSQMEAYGHFRDFKNAIGLGDLSYLIDDTGTCTEITDPKEQQAEMRMHGLIK